MLTSFNIQKQFIKLGSVLTDNPADLIIYIIPPDIDSLSIIVAQMKRDDEAGYLKFTLPEKLTNKQEILSQAIVDTMLCGISDLYETFSDYIELEVKNL